jgi:hypothetical protein
MKFLGENKGSQKEKKVKAVEAKKLIDKMRELSGSSIASLMREKMLV